MPTVWPGRPHPRGATFDGRGSTSRSSPSVATRVEVCLFDADEPTREIDRFDLPRRPGTSGTATCRAWSRAALRPARARPLRAGARAPLQPHKLLVDPYAKALHGEVDWTQPVFGYTLGTTPRWQRSAIGDRPARQRRGRAQGRWWSTTSSTGETTAARDAPGARRSSTRRTCAASPSCTRTCPRSCAAPTRGWPTRPPSSTCTKLGVTAVELLPVHEFADDAFLEDKRAAQLLGLQHARLLRPRAALRQPPDARARRSPSSRRW